MIAPTQTVGLVTRLCKTLDAEGVRYCHWKSNAALARSASGENDLDLLIRRADSRCFAQIMGQLGFHAIEEPPIQCLPGVVSYYGYDPQDDRLVHVHAHYQLVIGHDMTKNYRLALEEPYLASAVRQGLFWVPSAEFEYIVFVIRMVLKHSTWDALIGRQGALGKTERQELNDLQARIDQRAVPLLLRQHLPWLDVDLFAQAVRTIQPGCSPWLRLKTAQQLQNSLPAQARRSQLADLGLKWWRRLNQNAQQRLRRTRPKKRFVSGGAVIAVIGGDGSGKSTLVQALQRWLAKDFRVARVHLGKPVRSWSSLAVDGLLRLGRLTQHRRGPAANPGRTRLAAEPPGWFRNLRLLRAVCTARDRYHSYVRARRLAANGTLVICDRFPTAELPLTDGAVIGQLAEPGATERWVKWLAQLETHYYRQITWPELLIVLRVDPELAVQRRPDEDAAWVRRRNQEIWELNWQHTPAHVVDAGQPKEAVLAEVKALVWSYL